MHKTNIKLANLLTMTTSKNIKLSRFFQVQIKLFKQCKQNTTVSHVSQSNPTQATIALVVSNCKHAKTANLQNKRAQQSSPTQATIAVALLNCKHSNNSKACTLFLGSHPSLITATVNRHFQVQTSPGLVPALARIDSLLL